MIVTVNVNPMFFWDDERRKAHIFKVEGDNIGECLSRVTEKAPKLRPQMFTADGNLAQTVNIYVNRSPVYLDRLNHPVKDGDEIRVSPGGG